MSHHLQVDHRDSDDKIVNSRQEEKIPNAGYATAPASTWTHFPQRGIYEEIILRLRQRIRLLIATAILGFLLAIIAAGVGGAFVAKRQHKINDLQRQTTFPQTAPSNTSSSQVPLALSTVTSATTISSSCSYPRSIQPSTITTTVSSTCSRPKPLDSSTTTTTVTVTQSSTSCAVPARFTSSCSRLKSPYMDAVVFDETGSSVFTLKCGLDWPWITTVTDGHVASLDIMGTYVPTFEDCMDSCIRYNLGSYWHANSTCHGISFVASWGRQRGNCFLKAYAGADFRKFSAERDSAVLVGVGTNNAEWD